MTLTTTASEFVNAGNGVTTAFPTGFAFKQDADLVVELIEDATGVRTLQALTTDYTVSGAGSPSGGTVNFITAPPTGTTVYGKRVSAVVQNTQYTENDGFPEKATEQTLDNAIMVAQETQRDIGDSVRLPGDETAPAALPAKALRLDKMLGFNGATGQPELSTVTQSNVNALIAAWLAGTVNPAELNVTVTGTVAGLRGLTVANGMAALVQGHTTAGDGGGGVFRWDENSSAADDDGLTILPTGHSGNGRWKRILFGAINVRMFGAVLDGSTDVTAKINAAITAANALGGYTVVVDGDAHVSITSGAAVLMKSNVTLLFVNDARMTLEPNNLTTYDIIRCHDISNFAIIGAHITGDLDGHLGSTGEFGMCIELAGCTDFLIENGTFRKAWGDGLHLTASQTGGQKYCLRGRIVNCDCDGNRRQGMSIISVDDVEVVGGSYRNTSGTAPSAGIDVEPNNADERVRGLRMTNARFENNAGAGFLLSLQNLDGTSEPVDVVLEGCSAFGNENNFDLKASGGAGDHLKGRVHLVRPHSEMSDKAGIKIDTWDRDGLELIVEEPVVLDPAETATADNDKSGINIVRVTGTREPLGNITIVRPVVHDRRAVPKMLTCLHIRDNQDLGQSRDIRIIDPLKLAGFTGNSPYFNYEGAEIIDTFRQGVRDADSSFVFQVTRYFSVVQNSTFTALRTVTLDSLLKPGTRIVFEMTGAQTMRITPQAGDTILVLGTGAGASVDLTQQGARVTLRKISSTLWMPVEIHGWNQPVVARSGQIAITASSPHTFAHGLGVKPDFAIVEIENVTAELGWTAGQRAEVFHHFEDQGATADLHQGISVETDATNVTVRMAEEILVANKTGNLPAPITPANWTLRVLAVKFR